MLLGGTLLAALTLSRLSGSAEACPYPASTMPAPIVEDVGFEPPLVGEQGVSGGHLWVRLAPSDPLLPSIYVLEQVGGRAPRAVADWWGRRIAAQDDELVVALASPIEALERSSGRPLDFGFQVRRVDSSGRAGAPSRAVWMSFDPERAGRRITAAAERADRVLYFLLAIALGFFWYWYRREPAVDTKIRLAALAALASVVFLSVTAAMPWLLVEVGQAGRGTPLECLLGQEAVCVERAGAATLAAATSDPEQLSRLAFEVQRWQCASAALRMGQVTALALLLPALVWLLVDPRHRAAQATVAVGASVAGFALMVVLLYRHSVPPWIAAKPYRTADIAVLTTSSIVLAAVLIVRQSFASLQRTPLPAAVARYRRRRG